MADDLLFWTSILCVSVFLWSPSVRLTNISVSLLTRRLRIDASLYYRQNRPDYDHPTRELIHIRLWLQPDGAGTFTSSKLLYWLRRSWCASLAYQNAMKEIGMARLRSLSFQRIEIHVFEHRFCHPTHAKWQIHNPWKAIQCLEAWVRS